MNFGKVTIGALSIFIISSDVYAEGLFGELANEVLKNQIASQVMATELAQAGKPIADAPAGIPLLNSNGARTVSATRAISTPPTSLTKTLQKHSEATRSAVAESIASEIKLLTEQLNIRLASPNKTPTLNTEIDAINQALSAKREAYEFTQGTSTTLTNAGAESFAALNNPYFLVCGEALWAPKDPVRWIDQLEPKKSKLISVGRSVGLIMLGNRPAGTGFVVGANHVLTNMHVVKMLADFDPAKKIWIMRNDAKIMFDVEYPIGPEQNCPKPYQQRTYFVNGVYAESQVGDDIAILLTSKDPQFPAALPVSSRTNIQYQGNIIVAVIGYPGPPSDMTVAEQIEFFHTPKAATPQFPYKRLSEGYTGDEPVTDGGYFFHKANTAGGNSGSPIVDLSDGAVVGIHVKGKDRLEDVLGYNLALTGQRVQDLLRSAGLTGN